MELKFWNKMNLRFLHKQFLKLIKRIELFSFTFIIIINGTFYQILPQPNESKEPSTIRRLLRVWPSFRPEECDWAIRKFICLRCLKNGYQYAQEIHFLEDYRPYRIHGCYTQEKGFFAIPEGKDHPTEF